MNGDNSLFSCIKPVEEPPRYAPPAPPPHSGKRGEVPPPAPEIAALQDRLKKLEECSKVLAEAAETARAEVAAAQERSAELERKLLALNDKLHPFVDRPVNSALEPAEAAAIKREVAVCAERVASIEKDLHLLEPTGIKSVSLSLRLLEGRLKSVESGFNDELHERFSSLSFSVAEGARKAALAQEIAAAGVRRLEKLEELLVRLPCMENRFAALETKLERVYELDALVQALKLGVEATEDTLTLGMKEIAIVSGGQKRLGADFESLSSQVRQISALFNQFRTELSFLIPKKQKDNARD